MAIRVGGIEFSVRATTGQAVRALERLRQEFEKQGAQTKKATKNVGGLADATNALATSLSSLAAAFGAIKIGGFIRESALLAGRVQSLQTVLNNVGQIAGLNVAQLGLLEERVKALGITTQATRQALAQMAQANLDLRESARLARLAQNAAVIAGINSSEAFERLVVAIQRNDVRLLRNLGIVINLNNVYNRFAAQTGRTAQSLTAFEKRQLLLNEVLDRGRLIAGTYEASLADVFKRFTSLERLFEEASRTFGEQFLPVFERVVDTTTSFLKFLNSPEGAAFIRISGAVATAVVTFGALTAAIGTATVALKAFAVLGAAGGPLFAIAAAITGIVVLLQQLEAQARAVEERFRAVGDEARQSTQRLIDARKELTKLEAIMGNVGEATELTARAQQEFRSSIEQLIILFPELEVQLREAAQTNDIQRVIEEFALRVPEVFDNLDDRLNQTFIERERLLRRIARAQVATRAEFVAAEKLGIDLSEQRAAAEEIELQRIRRLSVEVGNFNQLRARGFAEIASSGRLSTFAIDAFNEELIRLDSTIESLQEAIEQLNFDRLAELARATEQAAAVALREARKLETERRKLFKDTTLDILDDFQEFASSFSATRFESEEQIDAFREAFLEQELRRIRRNRDAALEAADSEAARDEIRRKTAVASLGAIEEADRRASAAREQLTQVNNSLDDALENVNISLRRQANDIDALNESVDLLAAGLDDTLVRLRRNFEQEQREFELINEEFERRVVEVNKRIADLTLEFGQLVGTGREQAIAQERAFAEEELRQITRARELELQRQQVIERKFAIEFERERMRQLDDLLNEEERVQKRIRDIRGETTAVTLDEVREQIDAFRRLQQEVDEFIEDFRNEADEKLIPGITDSREALREFLDVLAKAQTQEQVAALAEQFPKQLKQIFETAQGELEEAGSRANEIRREFARREGAINRELREKQNELIAQGTPALLAQAEIERERAERQRELRKERREALDDEERRETGLRKLRFEQEELRQEFADATSQLIPQLQSIEDLEEREKELAEAALSEAEKELANIQTKLGLLKEINAEREKEFEFVRAVAGGPPPEEAPPAPAEGRVPGRAGVEQRRRQRGEMVSGIVGDPSQTIAAGGGILSLEELGFGSGAPAPVIGPRRSEVGRLVDRLRTQETATAREVDGVLRDVVGGLNRSIQIAALTAEAARNNRAQLNDVLQGADEAEAAVRSLNLLR